MEMDHDKTYITRVSLLPNTGFARKYHGTFHKSILDENGRRKILNIFDPKMIIFDVGHKSFENIIER